MPPKKASKRKKPIKSLVFGPSGAGKTHLALYATPGKTLVFDMEGGTDLFEGRVDFDYWTDADGYKTQSYRELRACIDYLTTPEGRANYETFVIDPVTLIWTLLQQERQDYKEQKILEKRKGREKENETDLESFTTRDWNIVKKMHKSIIDEVSNLPQNVFLIAREKPVIEMRNGEPVATGDITYEGEKNTIYAVDFAFRIWVDLKTQKRYCQITKDRSGTYKTGDIIPDPTFELFNSIVNDMAGAPENTGIKTNTENTFAEADKPAPNDFDVAQARRTFFVAMAEVADQAGVDKKFAEERGKALVYKAMGVTSLSNLQPEQWASLLRSMDGLKKSTIAAISKALEPAEPSQEEVAVQ